MRKKLGITMGVGAAVTVLTLSLSGMASAEAGGAGIANPPTAAEAGHVYAAGVDYPDAESHPAAGENYTAASRPSSNKIDKIVIHVTQGSWEGSLSWFQNPEAQASAHYTVRSSDGKIGQSVRESDIAWHAGNWEYNETSVGIEHEGFIDESKWFTEEMYKSSAKLAVDIAKEYDIPLDRDHIIGHVEVPGADHTDPGKHWDWDHYMELLKSYSA